MLSTLFITFLAIHGLIHLLGFIKSFKPAAVPQLKKEIDKITGFWWVIAGDLFIAVNVLISFGLTFWIPLLLLTVALSQYLIIKSWSDAKWGTIPNVIAVIVAVLAFTTGTVHTQYTKDVENLFKTAPAISNTIITEEMIAGFPEPVKKYMRLSGAVDKPVVTNMRVTFEGKMRGKGKDWFDFTTEQINFYSLPSRSFFMLGKMNGIPVPGYHSYIKGEASMLIKPLGIAAVVDIKGAELNKGETVTVLNDLCLMAPGSFVNPMLKFEEMDSLHSRVRYTVGSISVSAELEFNKKGELINFRSNDRYETNDKKWYPFSTPVRNYKTFPNGYTLASEGDAVWHYPDAAFIYGVFHLKSVEYNVAK